MVVGAEGISVPTPLFFNGQWSEMPESNVAII